MTKECELCGGDELTAFCCKAFRFRPDVAAMQIMKLEARIAELEIHLTEALELLNIKDRVKLSTKWEAE